MKCITTAIFKDKYTGQMYGIGEAVNWDDQERIDDCINRGLVMLAPEEEKPKKKATPKKTKN